MSNLDQLANRDPLSLVYAALWDVLESSADFCRLVQPGNRIKFLGTSRDPWKDMLSTADLPEVRIVPAGGAANLHLASNTDRLVQRLRVQVSSGDRRVDAAFFPVVWEIYRALVNWPSVIAGLAWNGHVQGDGWGVDLVEITGHDDTADNPRADRGIQGWSTVWTCETRFWFADSLIKPAGG
jgi:hypothetical protein